ncbi:PadR family transcriptional regulator [Modestobacter caceresii]|jgi:DNA-binding PadR family transcriptional regulator|uniref:PadR family transcriptional regulator n=1 Tax=Modestobacter caceresii TaxID=1522368 RepID=A0A098YDK5_9ACTN|nr:PadR family transcriptional regulator [Modestobacter caceresii]KGH48520.1 PadR family transcriptional regulator [Modestobacter caceresii]
MALGHVLLGLLARGGRHGYDLKRQYDARFPMAKPIAPAQVYATLERLLRDGLVAPGGTDRGGGPDRTSYEMTPAGRLELDAWLAEVEAPTPFVSNPLAVKVTLALLVAGDDAAADYLQRQRAAHRERMREYTRVKTDPDTSLAGVLAADYALNHLDADLRWIDTALARVASLSEELRP